MKKSPWMLMIILALCCGVALLNGETTAIKAESQFAEFLQGYVTPGTTSQYGEWMALEDEVITGSSLQGDLVGSPIVFTIMSSRRVKSMDGKSFIEGEWTFVAFDGSSISGTFRGNGTNITEFSGKFIRTMAQKSTGIYSGAKISGRFSCEFIEPLPYGDAWRYEAWWNGTFRGGGE